MEYQPAGVSKRVAYFYVYAAGLFILN